MVVIGSHIYFLMMTMVVILEMEGMLMVVGNIMLLFNLLGRHGLTMAVITLVADGAGIAEGGDSANYKYL